MENPEVAQIFDEVADLLELERTADTDRAGRHPRRPAHAHKRYGRARYHRRDGCGGQRPRLRLHCHHRSLQTRYDGQRTQRPSTAGPLDCHREGGGEIK